MSMSDASDLVVELNRVRLDRDLTYDDLAEEIGVDASAIHRFLNVSSRKPYDRTLHKVRQYLDKQKQQAEKPRRRRASA